MDAHETEVSDSRPIFTEHISRLRNNEIAESKHSPCTVEIVHHMNNEMVKNQVRMSPQHCQRAVESLDRGDCIVRFTMAENRDVLESQGTGLAYNAGRVYHQALSFFPWKK